MFDPRRSATGAGGRRRSARTPDGKYGYEVNAPSRRSTAARRSSTSRTAPATRCCSGSTRSSGPGRSRTSGSCSTRCCTRRAPQIGSPARRGHRGAGPEADESSPAAAPIAKAKLPATGRAPRQGRLEGRPRRPHHGQARRRRQAQGGREGGQPEQVAQEEAEVHDDQDHGDAGHQGRPHRPTSTPARRGCRASPRGWTAVRSSRSTRWSRRRLTRPRDLTVPGANALGSPDSRVQGGEAMYKQVLDPVGDSLFLSALFAMIPLATLFVLLGGLKLKAHCRGPDLAAAWRSWSRSIVYSMPVGQALDAGLEGAAFGLFPIMWIVWNAIWIFKMTEDTGHFAVLRRSFGVDLRRPADPGRDHRLLLRRAARGAGRVRHAGRDHRRDARRARLQADEGRVGRARRQHRAGRVRRDRDPDRHARRADRHPEGGPRRDGRPPDAAAGAVRAADPGRHGRRLARRARPSGRPRWSAASASRSASSRARTSSRSS